MPNCIALRKKVMVVDYSFLVEQVARKLLVNETRKLT